MLYEDKRFILSTVGTSILTNVIDNRANEAIWRRTLRDSANSNPSDLDDHQRQVIDTLARRAQDRLAKNDIDVNRRISAELNGIYGIYGGSLPAISNQDTHYLICTDTAQGKATGELIGDFLIEQGIDAQIYAPDHLSTKDTTAFATGAKDLVRWLEKTVPEWNRKGYRVVFNLVGGFKSLQGYMSVFGAFYADEMIYIFEAQSADLIRIPRLPVTIDSTAIKAHCTEIALMSAGKLYPYDELKGLPDILLEFIDQGGVRYAGLSAWGELLWNRTKSELLGGDNLVLLPRLSYSRSFIDDFRNQKNMASRVKLQETLAKVANKLDEQNGDTVALRGGGLQFGHFTGGRGLCKFRIDDAVRVTLEVTGAGLRLRRYGHKEHVYKNP